MGRDYSLQICYLTDPKVKVLINLNAFAYFVDCFQGIGQLLASVVGTNSKSNAWLRHKPLLLDILGSG